MIQPFVPDRQPQMTDPRGSRWMAHAMDVTDAFCDAVLDDEPERHLEVAGWMGMTSAFLWHSTLGRPQWTALDVPALLAWLASPEVRAVDFEGYRLMLAGFYHYLADIELVPRTVAQRVQRLLYAALPFGVVLDDLDLVGPRADAGPFLH